MRLRTFPWTTLAVILAAMFAAAPPGASAQTCPGSGGGSGGGGGTGITLTTIALDGVASDWANVLTNPLQTTIDGEVVSGNCSAAALYDRDCPGKTNNIGGRDLAQFSWTYDNTNIYLYLKRYGSTANQQTFLFYADTNQNQRMNSGEKVLKVTFSGSNGTLNSSLMTYTPAGGAHGDTSGDYMADPVTGYADGYTPWGTLSGGTTIDSGMSWVWADGTGFEARIPWTNLGVPAGTAVYFHVSSINGSGSNVPSGIDDNLGGPSGKMGVFGFYLLAFSPNRTSAVASSSPYVDDQHTVTNSGSLPDFYEFVDTSSLGWRVQIYDSRLGQPGTLMAEDTTGDGTWDSITSGYDLNGNGRPETPTLAPNGTFPVTVRLYPPTGVGHVQDQTTVDAVSGNSTTCLFASVVDTTTIGDLELTPSPQSKSVMPSQTVDYGLRLTNFLLADVFDLRALSSAGWRVDLYTDPNGDGNPSDGSLMGTDLTGDGTWDALYDDSNANGQPDPGTIASGGYADFVVRLTAPATVGATNTTTLTALGAAYGELATASVVGTVRNRLTLGPSYTVAAGTNRYSGPGVSVFYRHTLVNTWSASDNVTLSAVSNQGYTVRLWTDPNGDGNPSDGTLITSPVSLAAFGGSLGLVAEVLVPSAAPFGTTDSTTVTATSGSLPSYHVTATDEVKISRIASFADSLDTISKTVFVSCDTLYAKATNLVANTSGRYTIEYHNPSNGLARSAAVATNGNGEATDQYTFAAGDPQSTPTNNWTVRLLDGLTQLDAISVKLEPVTGSASPAITSLALSKATYALTGDAFSVTATYQNNNAIASFGNTAYEYLVLDEGATKYLKADGTFATYSGTQFTRTTSPHTVAAGASDTETVSVSGVAFPQAGTYQLLVTWAGACGSSVASATRLFTVGSTLGSFASDYVTSQESFSLAANVYLAGQSYLASSSYVVAYYGPSGGLVTSQNVTSAGSGLLQTSIAASSLNLQGTWHAVVYPSGATLPLSYAPGDPASVSFDSFTLDFASPSTPVISGPADGSSTTNTRPPISGTAEANSIVKVYVDGVLIGTTTTDGSGSWTYTPASDLGFGAHTVNATATDAAGNVSATSNTHSFNVIYPTPVVTSPISAGATSISGTSSAPAGTTLTVYGNGVAIGTTTVQAGGTWTLSGVSGLVGGESITATAGTGAAQSSVSSAVVVTPLAPSVNSPIIAGATSVSGTSSAPVGSTITVYRNGSPIGTTTVLGGGTWTLSGVGPLGAGDVVKATVSAGGQTSGDSNLVTVLAPSVPPIVSSSLVTGAGVTVYGSSVEPAGSVVTVYVNGVPQATQPVVQADGSWSLPGLALAANDVVTASVFSSAPNKTDSGFGNQVLVSASAGTVTQPPAISTGIAAGATTVSGTSAPNAVVDVYADGVYLGTVTADGSGNWTLSGLTSPLAGGAILTATATTASGGTSDWSAPVVVGTIVHMLRADAMTTLAPPPSTLFTHKPQQLPYPSLETLGPNHRANSGEQGITNDPTQPSAAGTADDDKFYLADVKSGDADPDTSVLNANDSRKLVFYELLDDGTKTLKLSKSGGQIIFTIQ